ncbi:MAG: AarF/ABC1/UbiB kinase family protein [Acidobacteria bacterium]|nr:AarF/ABC1/UbiB kinase family protein [Acidobacteriota bacterium]
MTRRPSSMPGGADTRRRDVEARIAALARLTGARGRLHVVARHGREEEDLPRLIRELMESLGGAFLLFGRYLAARHDLLPARWASAFDALPEWAEPLEPSLLREVIGRGLGSAAERFAYFDSAPTASHVAWQAHRALLDNGRAVVVRVSRPELAADADHLDRLAPLGEVLPPECPPEAFAAAIDDFRSEFQGMLDMRRERDALDQLAQDAESFTLIAAPRVHAPLSCDSVLTCESVGAATLADQMCGAGARASREDVARLIALAWLQQATAGRVFPAVLRPEAIEVCGRCRIAFSTGPFHAVPPQYQAALREYLHNAVRDPDRAVAAFLQQMRPRSDGADVEGLRRQFRQAVPFRDSDWCDGADDGGIEQYLWVHWRRATSAGFVLLSHMTAFYRGLTAVARIAQTLAPDGDVLRRALQDLQETERIRNVVSAVDPDEVRRMAAEYFHLALTLPERVDDLLQHASAGRVRLRVGMPADGDSRRRPASVLLVILLVFGIAILLGNGGQLSVAVWMRALIVAALTAAVVVLTEEWT